ncbi:unnamed protein product [Caenorhabditis brenneri]
MEDSSRDRKNGKLLWKVTTAVLAFIVVVLLFLFIKLLFLYDEEVPKQYGMFTSKPTFDTSSAGRAGNDLQNVAIVLKCTSNENSERWLTGIKKQRKTANDLPIYIYPDNATDYPIVKRIIKNFDNVKAIRIYNGTILHSDILKNSQIEYIIEAEDNWYIGADFADYYYFGQKVMKLDKTIECVCGGSSHQTREFFQPSQGDMFWLSDHEDCDLGSMLERTSFASPKDLPTCLRSEVPRVSLRDDLVTKMSFNVAKMDPNLWTVEQISKRMEYEMKTAKKMQKLDWDDLKRQDEQIVYKFPFATEDELTHYFDTVEHAGSVMNAKMFNNTIPLFVDGRKVYIVAENSEDRVEAFFKFF